MVNEPKSRLDVLSENTLSARDVYQSMIRRNQAEIDSFLVDKAASGIIEDAIFEDIDIYIDQAREIAAHPLSGNPPRTFRECVCRYNMVVRGYLPKPS